MPAELFMGVGAAVVKLFLRAAEEGNVADALGDAHEVVTTLLAIKSSDPRAKRLAKTISASVEHDLKRHKTPPNDLRSAAADVQSLLEELQDNHDFILYAGRSPSYLFQYTQKNFAGKYRMWISSEALRTFDRCLEAALRELAKLIPTSPSFQHAALLSLMDSSGAIKAQQAELLSRASRWEEAAHSYMRERKEARIANEVQIKELARLHLSRTRQLLQQQIHGLNHLEDPLPLLTYESQPDLDAGCVDLALTNEDGSRVPREELGARDNTRAIILRAPAGAGKSVTFRQNALRQARSSMSEATIETVRVPVYIDVGRSGWRMDPTKPTAVLSRALGIEDAAWLEDLLATGRISLYLDGIEGLDSDLRRQVQAWCQTIADEFLGKGNSIAVALRPHTEFRLKPQPREMRIEPIGASSAQVLTLKLLDHVLPSPSRAFESKGALLDGILATLWRPEMQALRENPLLCSLVVWQALEENAPRPSISVTIDEALTAILSKGSENELQSPISINSLRTTCETLAHYLYRMDADGAAVSSLLTELGARSEGAWEPVSRTDARRLLKSLMAVGVLEREADGQIRFRYSTFRSFSAGQRIASESNGALAAEARGIKRMDEFRWSFLATSPADRVEYVRAFLDDQSRKSGFVPLFLLSAALASDPDTDDFRREITQLLCDSRAELGRLSVDQIATLSDLALPALESLLAEPLPTAQVRAIVRAILGIGTERAFALMQTVDPNVFRACAAILLEGWQDALHSAYGRQILSRYVRDIGPGSVIATSPANFRHADLLPEQIVVLGRLASDIVLTGDTIPSAIEFCSFQEWTWKRFSDVASQSTHLRRLRLIDPVGDSEEVNWSALTAVESLTVISRTRVGRSRFEVGSLRHLPNLRKVRLCGLILSGSEMHLPAELDSLILEDCDFADEALPTVSGGGRLVEIQWDNFSGSDLSSIQMLGGLRRIHLLNALALESTAGVADYFPLLEEIVITACLSLRNLEGVSELKNLERATFEDCWNLPEQFVVRTSHTLFPLGTSRSASDYNQEEIEAEEEWERHLDQQSEMTSLDAREDEGPKGSPEEDPKENSGDSLSVLVGFPRGRLGYTSGVRGIWGDPVETKDVADIVLGDLHEGAENVLEGPDTSPAPAQRRRPAERRSPDPLAGPSSPTSGGGGSVDLEAALRRLGENIYRAGGGPDERLGGLLATVDTLLVACRSSQRLDGLLEALEESAIAVEGRDELQGILECVHFTCADGERIRAALQRGAMRRGDFPTSG